MITYSYSLTRNDIPLHGMERRIMQLIDRALTALTTLSRYANGLSVSELSEKLEIPMSSTHRILTSLKKNNFVIQDEETKKYRLGYKVFSLCSGIQKNNSLILAARPQMKELAKAIKKTIILCVMENEKIINLDCIENQESSMYMVKVGSEMPLYATSAGRVFAAYMNRGRVLEIFRHTKIKAETPYTKTSIEALCTELDDIREKGYAIIDEELQLGIQGVACPIFDGNGKVIAVIAFTSIKRADPVDKKMILKLQESAEIISEVIL